MSAWRRVAIEKLPECRDLIQKADTIGMLWVELWWPFADAHEEPVNHDFIGRVYQLAMWCVEESQSRDVFSATAIGFYEDLPTDPLVRREIARWLAGDDFSRFSDLFKYHLDTDAEFAVFKREFRDRKIEISREALVRKKASRETASG